jgi:ribonuclease Z
LDFQLKILGANSATPAYGRHQTSQLLTIDKYHFMIDCGEGAQIQLVKYKAKPSKINHIFISHLHGDHFFGLMGLLTSMSLNGRENDLHVFGPPHLAEIITMHLKYTGSVFSYKLHFTPIEQAGITLYENEILSVDTIPLDHRVPCYGFVFREKPKPHLIDKDKLLSVEADNLSIQDMHDLKAGKDLYDHRGSVRYKNEALTFPPRKSRSYAYCSDTRFNLGLVDWVQQVDLLYHEATFLKDKVDEAQARYHSTSEQAATLAQKAQVQQLIIGHYSSRYKELSPFLDEAQAVFPNTSLAIEGEDHIIAD